MSVLFNETALVVPFELLRMTDVESVGGKNASLGEMISQLPSGVRVPTGFATTAHAFRQFLAFGGLTERINARLDALDTRRLFAPWPQRVLRSAPWLKPSLSRPIWNKPYAKNLCACRAATRKLRLRCDLRQQPKTCLTLLSQANKKPS